jgi:hypothetical protein
MYRQQLSRLGLHPTSKQIVTLAERSNHLRRCIANWIEVQECYVPEARISRQRETQGYCVLQTARCTPASPIVLPVPNVTSATQDLHVCTHLHKQKDKYSRVRHNTRSNSTIRKYRAKVDRAAKKSHASRDTMLTLSAPSVVPEWNDALPVLRVEDVCCLLEALMGDSEGRRRPSWVWTRNTGIGEGSADVAGDEVRVLQATCLQELNTQRSSEGRVVSLSCTGDMVCRRDGTPT